MMKTCQRFIEDIFSETIFCLPRCLEDDLKMSSKRHGRRKIVKFHYDKKDNRFVISLGFACVLHHCNTKDSLYNRITLLNVCD